MVERFLKDLDQVVLRVGADVHDSDDGPDSGVDILVAHTSREQYANDDLQGRRPFYPSEQPLEKLATLQFLVSIQARSHQLTANPQEGAVSD